MELVPIIYNSLVLVFSLLALVIGGSLICSKLLFCGHNDSKSAKVRQNKVQIDALPRKMQTVQREIAKRTEMESRKSQSKIERKLIDNKKVKIVSRSARRKMENAQRVASNNAARYSVLNPDSQENTQRRELFQKFSKMSIEYSQSA